MNDWWMAARNALAVAVPLAAGIEMGNSLAAVALAIGALNVAYSDGRDPYFQRGRRMLLWSVLSGVAVFFGSITGSMHSMAILSAAAWAFAAGMMTGINTRMGDLGLNTLVTVVVFAARGSTTPLGALYSGLLVTAGGCLQTLMALLFWPLRRSRPQSLAVGQAFQHLAAEVDPEQNTPAFSPIRKPDARIEETLSALGADHTLEGERFRLLFDQADRLRLSIYVVKRLRDELGEADNQHSEAEGDVAEDLDHFLAGASRLLAGVAELLQTDTPDANMPELRQQLVSIVERAQQHRRNSALKLGEKIASALDIVAGQLRLVVQLAANTTTEGESDYLKSDRAKPSQLQPSHWSANIKANLTWKSAVFRHAVRLSACVAMADALQRSIGWHRAYWIPMTVAVVLKPDFSSTVSRGVLRLAGTIAGLIVATLAYHALPQSGWTQFLLVGIFAFFIRYLGPANYGIFTVAISGLIVFLLAATGVSPADVVSARALNTIAGGLLALAAYLLWPTWERFTVSDSLADMLDSLRTYLRGVESQLARTNEPSAETLDEERTQWRLKRSAAEAAVDRVLSEPGNKNAQADCLYSMLASSSALVHAATGLEAGSLHSVPVAVPPAFKTFFNDVDFTLYYLSSALRGSDAASRNLPQLREDHRRLLEARDSFASADEYVLIETDRLTVSLNTLREQVTRYVAGGNRRFDKAS